MKVGLLVLISAAVVTTVPYTLIQFEQQQHVGTPTKTKVSHPIQQSLSTFKQESTLTTQYTRQIRKTTEAKSPSLSNVEILTTTKHGIEDDSSAITPSIRKWGCQRNETPLIFVHVGKSGGGMVRARFAAGAQSYNRTAWNNAEEDEHYYPISDNRKAKFCNSLNHHARAPINETTFEMPPSFEGSILCNATTPLGFAIACPQPLMKLCQGCQSFLKSDQCDTIYAGHNYIGSELRWLPPKYLQKWWNDKWSSSRSRSSSMTPANDDAENIEWSRLDAEKNAMWCEDGYLYQNKVWHRRPLVGGMQKETTYLNCGVPLARKVDEQFLSFWENRRHTHESKSIAVASTTTTSHGINMENNFSPIYASLPLHRVTILRDPWSWLGSKFFWNFLHKENYTCENDLHLWAEPLLKDYLQPLCGEDCANRFAHGMMTYEEMGIQAESNLRQAFSVVGLLNETQDFYDMISARIRYIDMSLNPHVVGETHLSAGPDHTTVEPSRCKAIFEKADFQEEVRQYFPAMKILERVYNVAVEVNRFQREELNQCNSQ
jgi:hypothetical protein